MSANAAVSVRCRNFRRYCLPEALVPGNLYKIPPQVYHTFLTTEEYNNRYNLKNKLYKSNNSEYKSNINKHYSNNIKHKSNNIKKQISISYYDYKQYRSKTKPSNNETYYNSRYQIHPHCKHCAQTLIKTTLYEYYNQISGQCYECKNYAVNART